MSNTNFFLVNRALLSSDRWLSETFTRGQAWVDMFGLAQHSEGFIRVRGIKVDVLRGQLAYSQVSLSQRWKWSRKKVKRYLDELEKNGDVVQQNNEVTTLITIVKYDFWQRKDVAEEQQKVQQKHSRSAAEDTHTIRNNKEKKEKKVNTLSKDKEASPRKYEDGTDLILLKDEVMSQIDDRDRSFPRKRVFGDEKTDWVLDYTEHLLGRKLGGKELWNRRYARHLWNKYGITKVKSLLEYVCAPESWWYDKLSQMGTLYKHSERLFAEMTAKPKTENKIKFIS